MKPHDSTLKPGPAVRSPLLVPEAAVHLLREEARSAYPRECCGFLFGFEEKGVRRVERVRSVPNVHPTRPESAYRISPQACLRAGREARAEGLDIVGVYHSHPDGEPAPSERDRREALPGWSYLVLAVSGGEPGPPASWSLSGDGLHFHRERLEVVGA